MIPLSLSAALFLGGLISQDRPVTEKFHRVAIAGGIKAVVKKGEKPSVVLKGDGEDLERIEVVVKSGTLVVQPKPSSSLFQAFKRKGVVNAELTVAAFDGLELSGGSEAKGDGVSGEKCEIEQSGGSTTELKGVACEALELEASGGSSVGLEGTAKNLDLESSGGGSLKLGGLEVTNAKVEASGGTQGVLSVKGAIDGELSGGSTLTVKGQPKVANLDKSGGSSMTLEK